jgi:hypothetical protein
MLITKQKGISPSGGIMGFSRNFDFDGDAPGPLYYDALYNSSMITSRIFATFYADTTTQSFFQIGAYDTIGEYYSGSIVWLPVSDTFFWTVSCTAYEVGGV